MKYFSFFLLLAGSAIAVPIYQDVDALRAAGLSEKQILARLNANHPTPAYTGSPLPEDSSEISTVYSPIDRDTDGDISPGSIPIFHYAEHPSIMKHVVNYVVNTFGGETTDQEHLADSEGKPAWRFKWMGGAWASAASKVARMQQQYQ